MNLGLWKGQQELLNAIPRAIAEHKAIYVGSGHALGKDFLAGGIPLWWQYSRYPAKTILTGPTERQVHEITWNELTRHANRWAKCLVPIGGHQLQGKWEWDEEHFILAMTTSFSEQHVGKLQGFHSPNICIIVTEAQAVHNSIKEQLDGLTTSGNVLFIAIGNPLVTTGWFADGLRDHAKNIVINLDCEESPNVLEGREIIPGLVSKAWVDEKRQEWYEENPNHPLWLSKVKGQIPNTSVDSVFSRSMFDEAFTLPVPRIPVVSLGVDPAEFGDDESAFCLLNGGKWMEMSTTSKHEPTDTAGRARTLLLGSLGSVVSIDRTGVGAGVASMLKERKDENKDPWTVEAVNFGEKPVNLRSPYLNRRAELYFHAREQLVAGNIEAPKDKQTVEELCEMRYFFNSKGKMQLEKKEEIKERLGRSPDRADAWVLAVWGLRSAKALPLDQPKSDNERIWDAVHREQTRIHAPVDEYQEEYVGA